jgi:deoxyribodipyrimidine photo-lyase
VRAVTLACRVATPVDVRIRALNVAPERVRGAYVLYWMTSARRARSSFALDHAVAAARRLGRPLLVLEALRAGYRYASDRLHAFVLAGMADNAKAFAAAGVTYLPYVEPEPGAGRGLVEHLAAHACLAVTDDFPTFFVPRMLAAVGPRLPVATVAIDGNGLLPMRLSQARFGTAMAFRRHLQRALAAQLTVMPAERPLAGKGLGGAELPRGTGRWAPASTALLAARPDALARLPVDHAVPVSPVPGGMAAARLQLADFVDQRLERYPEGRSHPDEDASSGFSPYLHFGHLGVHEVLRALARREDWSPARLGSVAHGKREGFWGMSPAATAFLDELVTWRELGFSLCAHEPHPERYESLPEWARRTLDAHAGDPRPERYDLATLEAARTGDQVWNAAQRQLVAEGRMHNYLRMLWGKKLLEWTDSPREALQVMFHLNDRHALDGRDPNSITGITWCLGRYDRPWAPVRPIFGSIRYMSSANTLRKLRLRKYLEKWSGQPRQVQRGH